MLDPLSGYGSKILDGISRYVQRKPNWRMAFFDRERKELAELVETWQGDAIICTVVDPRFREAAASRKDIPVINVAGLMDETQVCSVLSDDQAIGRLAAEHLISRGFKDFAFVRKRDGTRYSQDRGAGFQARVEEAGFKVTSINLSANHSDDELIEKLASLPRPLGVFAALDRIAGMISARRGPWTCRRVHDADVPAHAVAEPAPQPADAPLDQGPSRGHRPAFPLLEGQPRDISGDP